MSRHRRQFAARPRWRDWREILAQSRASGIGRKIAALYNIKTNTQHRDA